jgi:serine/threonine-protein kinase
VVEAELRERGLAVDRAPEERTDVPAGQVTALDPVEGLAEGGVVTVSYAVAPVATPAPPPPAEDTKDEDQGGKEDQDQKDEDKKGDGDQGGGNGRGDGGKKDD